jgi:hypothetical protein
MKLWIKIALLIAVLAIATFFAIAAMWDRNYLRCVELARRDYLASHADFGDVTSPRYLAFGIEANDSETAVDRKLARAKHSIHLRDEHTRTQGFTIDYEVDYGPRSTNPDGTTEWLYIEHFYVDFDENGKAFYVHQTLFRSDVDSQAHDIDLRTGVIRSY